MDDRRVATMSGRGGSRCLPTCYIDGIMIERVAEIDELVPAGTVHAVEIHRRASTVPPSSIRPFNNDCGAIVFWTSMSFGG